MRRRLPSRSGRQRRPLQRSRSRGRAILLAWWATGGRSTRNRSPVARHVSQPLLDRKGMKRRKRTPLVAQASNVPDNVLRDVLLHARIHCSSSYVACNYKVHTTTPATDVSQLRPWLARGRSFSIFSARSTASFAHGQIFSSPATGGQ